MTVAEIQEYIDERMEFYITQQKQIEQVIEELHDIELRLDELEPRKKWEDIGYPPKINRVKLGGDNK